MNKIDFYFLTLFPEVFDSFLNSSLLKKAQEKSLVSFEAINIRDFATDSNKTADDAPYGGGEGMLLKADVLYRAWEKARNQPAKLGQPDIHQNTLTLYLSPQGEVLSQKKARGFIDSAAKIILVCGHYEGIDQRFIDQCVDQEVSIGDYILTGGELPALVFTDVMSRLIPGVVGNPQSVAKDSLENGLLKYPQYTRPQVALGQEVPQVLLSGNHKEIAQWRQDQRRLQTSHKRADLLNS